MGKQKTVYVCQNCGYQLPKWTGKCPECEQWNTVEEEISEISPFSLSQKAGIDSQAVTINQIEETEYARMQSGMSEIDRVLGSGIVRGSVVLIGGEPGIGKTTLLYQLISSVSSKDFKSLYVSGEESLPQAKIRASRMNIDSSEMYFISESRIEVIKAYINKIKPKIVAVDSVQVVSCSGLSSGPGTISQIREAVNQLTAIAKQNNITIFLVGHVTKIGTFAGPKLLEHMVDTVLYFEGERYSNYRMLKCMKNRFGSTEEIGFFDMTSEGLKEVKNPSELFISERPSETSGSVICPLIEGTRAILVEVQALVCDASFGTPLRRSAGIDYNRVSLIIAVLEKRAGLILRGMDVFVKIAGGIKVTEPATDLAVAVAIASSFKNKPVQKDVIAAGEVGLGGEIRNVTNINKRVSESFKTGFKKCVVPHGSEKSMPDKKNKNLVFVKDINQAIELLL